MHYSIEEVRDFIPEKENDRRPYSRSIHTCSTHSLFSFKRVHSSITYYRWKAWSAMCCQVHLINSKNYATTCKEKSQFLVEVRVRKLDKTIGLNQCSARISKICLWCTQSITTHIEIHGYLIVETHNLCWAHGYLIEKSSSLIQHVHCAQHTIQLSIY